LFSTATWSTLPFDVRGDCGDLTGFATRRSTLRAAGTDVGRRNALFEFSSGRNVKPMARESHYEQTKEGDIFAPHVAGAWCTSVTDVAPDGYSCHWLPSRQQSSTVVPSCNSIALASDQQSRSRGRRSSLLFGL